MFLGKMDKRTRPKITWFVPKPRYRYLYRMFGYSDWNPEISLASVWIRSYQLVPYLSQKYDINCNLPDQQPDVAIFLRRLTAADILLAKQLKSKGTKIILDVVVNYFEARDGGSGGYRQSSQQQVEIFFQFIELADQIWTVSPFLQVKAAQYHKNSHFVSDSVDINHFRPPTKFVQNRLSAESVILGWAGVSPKAKSLEEIAPIIKPFIDNGQIKVVIITRKRPKLSFPFDFYPWRYKTFPSKIAQCDLCIAPRVVDNDYTRGHSIFKIGAFMALGVPALAGPVPSYDLLLGDGKGGVICQSYEDWDYYINEFINNDVLRNEESQNAYQKIQPYITSNICSQVDRLISEMLNI